MPGGNAASGTGRPKDGERILDFSLGQAHLSLRYEQLLVQRDEQPDVSVPIEEVAVVVLASRMLTCTLPLLDAFMRHGVCVIVCDESMHPSGMMLPLDGHFQQTRRLIAQATAKLPVKKRVWREIVIAKVRAQGSVLALHHGDDAGLYRLATEVRSGDPENIESQAAQRYWPRLFGDPDFLRRRDAPNQNRLLNYGYAVLRAAVGRAVVASGLHPSLGVHHHGRSNAYCLADDLMEPYRPLVDDEVAEITASLGGDIALDGPVKQRLVGVLHERLDHSERGTDGPSRERRTIIEWIARSAASLGRILGGEAPDERVFFPSGLTHNE